MQIHEKIKLIRESKKLSQSYLAHELNLDQSQYSRREKGEIQFVSNEIIKLSKLLNTTISELFDEANGEHVSVSLKLIEQYEFRIKEKDELIAVLIQLNENKKISNF